jgi:hypothetical protein
MIVSNALSLVIKIIKMKSSLVVDTINGVFAMAPELNSSGELTKTSETPQLRSSQLRGVFGVVVHFFRVPFLQL